MELNFDKEMDALLRQAARQETPAQAANAAEAHLDADELAAFSANALPVKARARAMEHLTDCGNCRTILSNLVFFENQEEEKPAAFMAAIAAPIAKESSLMERILGVFKFPTLAYGMAALVLLFTGAIGLMILRNNSGGVEMAQVSNKELSAATKAVAEQLQDTANEPLPALNTNMAANAAPMAAAANNAMGGAFSVPVPAMPGGYAANSTSNVSSTLRKDTGPAELEEQPKLKPAPVVIDGISTEAAPPPPPPAMGTRQEFRVNKPEQPLTDQVTRGNNVQNNILTPDGSDKDRRQRAVTGEAGANLSRETTSRDETDKLDANDSKAGAPAKTAAPAKAESKKASNKKGKKNAAAAAEASATPAATPAKTPEPKKTPQKPDDEERPPL